MALTKDVKQTLTINHNGVFEYRRTTTAFDDDGTEIGQRHWRATYPPTTTISSLPTPLLQKVATAVWTQAVIDAYVASQQ